MFAGYFAVTKGGLSANGNCMAQNLSREDAWRSAMRAARNGDAAAYRRLLAELAPFLRMICRRAGGTGLSAADLEDAVQETLIAVHLKRESWDEDQAFSPWLAAIARNKAIDVLRRRGRRGEIELGDCADILAAPDEFAAREREMERDGALELLAELKPGQRAVIEAVSIRGESFREAAQKLELSEGALRVALHRGLKALGALYRARQGKAS